jgi:uncharacterized coiled-coil protein SlyX
MLRAKVMQDVFASLEVGGFYLGDFDVVQKDDGGSDTHLLIHYRSEPQYFFRADLGGSMSGGLLKVCPGRHKVEEFFSVDSVGEMYAQIKLWVERIHEELMANPVNRQFETMQAQIDDLVTKLKDVVGEDGASHFTPTERQRISDRLTSLETKLAQQITKSATDVAAADQKIIELAKDIELLKNQLATLRKSGWASSFAIRAVKWAAAPENQAFLHTAYDVVKGVLGP